MHHQSQRCGAPQYRLPPQYRYPYLVSLCTLAALSWTCGPVTATGRQSCSETRQVYSEKGYSTNTAPQTHISGLKKWAEQIQGSVCFLNETKPNKGKTSQATRIKIHAEVLIPTTGQLKEKPSTASLQLCSCILRLKGHLPCMAVMNAGRVTAKTVITYLKRDIMRSVSSSAKNVFEHLMIDDNLAVNTLMGFQPLAQRVFALVPHTGLSVWDYMLPSEAEAAVQERISKWVGFTIPDGKLHVTHELVQGRLQWHQASEEGIDSTWLPVIKLQQKRRIIMGVAVASGVALVACLVYMLFLSE